MSDVNSLANELYDFMNRQKQENDKLKKEIKQLRERIQSLEDDVARLK